MFPDDFTNIQSDKSKEAVKKNPRIGRKSTASRVVKIMRGVSISGIESSRSPPIFRLRPHFPGYFVYVRMPNAVRYANTNSPHPEIRPARLTDVTSKADIQFSYSNSAA